ncbi:hypothetical protein SAMN04488073_3236 [Marinobacter gudaonensis]|uniref:Peptidase M66 n=1 Tax=Marinobacter gudaonensis TaxID=375760 RepID=A0A1I6HZI7_9GAMM|nr:hypothetical protein [Marinobacter gudaonensis]SFR59882.1 hypothetical protein SAMN04488073_3236 [Marinobacter gudaonensis]
MKESYFLHWTKRCCAGAALTLMFVAQSQAQAIDFSVKAGSVHVAQSHVMNADGAEGPNDGAQPVIVGNRDLLFKVNFVADQSGITPDQFMAWLTVYNDGLPEGQSFALDDPLAMTELPVSYDNDPVTMIHTFDDSYSVMIPGNLIKPGLRWTLHWALPDNNNRVLAAHQLKSPTLTVNPPVSYALTMIDIEWFEPQFTGYPAGFWDEMAQKLPITELDLRQPPPVLFTKVAMPGSGAQLPQVVSSSADFTANITTGSSLGRGEAWVDELRRAPGDNGYELSNFGIANHASVGGNGSKGNNGYFFVTKAKPNNKGLVLHEMGHSLDVFHWATSNAAYPYRDPDKDGPITYETYLGLSTGSRTHNVHGGPYWTYDTRNVGVAGTNKGTFIAPWVDSDGDGNPDFWKASPMQGGGAADKDDGFEVTKFSDYEINHILGILNDKAYWFDTQHEWISNESWEGPGWYWGSNGGQHFTGDGLGRPIASNMDVYSLLISASMASDNGAVPFALAYPPIGPYKANVRTLFDPTLPADMSALAATGQCPVNGCDLTLRVVQGGQTSHYVLAQDWNTNLPYSNADSFIDEAINLPASAGIITSVEVLLTDNAETYTNIGDFPASPVVLNQGAWPYP